MPREEVTETADEEHGGSGSRQPASAGAPGASSRKEKEAPA